MNNLLDFSFLSWTQFFIVFAIIGFITLIVTRFHIFDKHNWKNSIGYHVFFIIMFVILIISFIFVKPVLDFLLVLVVMAFFHKNIFGYIRSVLSLYFSGIKIGDHVRIDNAQGRLNEINFGGIQILAHDKTVFYPFNSWKMDKVELLSQDGTVPLSFTVSLGEEQMLGNSIDQIKDVLFSFPYLAKEKIELKTFEDRCTIKLKLASDEYKESVYEQLEKAGFNIKPNK